MLNSLNKKSSSMQRFHKRHECDDNNTKDKKAEKN